MMQEISIIREKWVVEFIININEPLNLSQIIVVRFRGTIVLNI
jgi:hypothetical protein